MPYEQCWTYPNWLASTFHLGNTGVRVITPLGIVHTGMNRQATDLINNSHHTLRQHAYSTRHCRVWGHLLRLPKMEGVIRQAWKEKDRRLRH